MGRFIKQGRVVILLSGRYAGKKAVVVKTFDEGTTQRKFAHCLVAGISKHPLFITKSMPEKKQQRRTRVRAFTKYVNYQHMIPTRYLVSGELDLKTVVTEEKMATVASRKDLRKELRNLFSTKYSTQKVPKKADKSEKSAADNVKFFFNKLRF